MSLVAVDVTAWAVIHVKPIAEGVDISVEGLIIGPYEDAVKLRSQLIDEAGVTSREGREQYVLKSTFVWNYPAEPDA